MSYAVEVSHLEVRFGELAPVNDVSLQVNYGEVVGLLGPNGAGKTTLVETLLGFRAPHAGTVRLHGLDPLSAHAEVVARTGALLQRGGVWAPMTPKAVLHLTASYFRAPREVPELLDLLDLRACANTAWRRLSGGEQQRTLLALALLGRPRVLVLDEPTTAVDPEGRRVIREILSAEKDRGCALLITTHELVEAERLCERLVIMHNGRVLAEGGLAELAGAAEMIVEISEPVDVEALAQRLSCVIRQESATTLRCSGAASPERISIVTEYLASVGSSLITLRTRASLEERYLELIGDERETS